MASLWYHPALAHRGASDLDPSDFRSPDFVERLPDAAALARSFEGADAGNAPAESALPAWLRGALGAPAEDLTGSPLSARASALGLRTGCAFYHHERRVRIGMPAHMEPEVAVWTHGARTTPVWDGGVLTEPKYFSFFQDAALPSYNPNHRSKWRSHELLHAAVGFYYAPSQTRFQAYLGARLGELLPVVHWYGFDEIARRRCIIHTHGDPPKHTCLACEANARGVLKAGHLPNSTANIELARSALDHFDAEWRACLAELETGRTHRARSGSTRLDASSDAIGYLRGHWPRLSSPAMAAWVERFCAEGVDYCSALEDYAANVARACAELLVGEITVDHASYIALQRRRVLRDVAWRALLALEHATEERPSDSVERCLDRVAERCGALLEEDTRVSDAAEEDRAMVDELFSAIASDHRLHEDVLFALPCLGHDLLGEDAGYVPGELEQVMQGISGATPVTYEAMIGAELDMEEIAIAMVSSPAFGAPGLLSQRVASVLLSQDDELLGLLGSVAEIEAWFARPPRVDDFADAFAMIPAPGEVSRVVGGTVRLHASARRAVWPLDSFAAVIGDEEEYEPGQHIDVVAAVVAGEVVILEVDEALDAWWEIATLGREVTEEDLARAGEESLLGLLEAGVLVWSGEQHHDK